VGDSTPQEDRLRELLRHDDQEADEKDKRDLLICQKFCQFYLCSFLVLTLLWAWLGTTAYFMEQVMKGGEEPDYETHQGQGYDYVAFIHNVLFGLVTAVVIQELGEEVTETSLYYRFLPTYREQRRCQREHRILSRKYASKWKRLCSHTVQFVKTYLMGFILWSTRIYTFVWICLGTASLGFGAIIGIDASNPLYTTGQTWLGIAVTIGYTYFGLNGKNALKLENDGNDDASGGEEARSTDEKAQHRNNDAAVQAASTLKKQIGKKQVSSAPSSVAVSRHDLASKPPVKAASTSKKQTGKKKVYPVTPSSDVGPHWASGRLVSTSKKKKAANPLLLLLLQRRKKVLR